MGTESILQRTNQGVAEIQLNRPHVLNSFNRPMAIRLQEALASAGADPQVRCVLLSGAGRAFCAGQDLAEAAPADAPLANVQDIVQTSYNPIVRAIRNIEKPFVCAVNGIAAGAGANIALACDFVIAARDAGFLQAFSKIGLVPDSGGTFFLPRLIGTARATALMMLGEKLPAEEAERIGLIHRVVDPEALNEEALGLARKLAAMPTRALGLIKQALNRSLANELEAQLEVEARLQGIASSTEDYREGVEAFLGKRKPVFQGR